jgi:hypothetical protein
MIRAQEPLRILALCADDFGLGQGVSDGIARLAHAGRLSAVSCITNSAYWLPAAPLLARVASSVSVGLHINLTEGMPLSTDLMRVWPRLPGLHRLVLMAHAGALPRAALRAELQAQLDAFHRGNAAGPGHLDGHQHVHHLPGIRDLVLELLSGCAPIPLVRNTGCLPGPGFALKRWLIRHTGVRQLGRVLRDRHIPHNTALLGVHDFAPTTDYRAWMRRWLAALPPGGAWLFCHPGLPGPGSAAAADRLQAGREREYA